MRRFSIPVKGAICLAVAPVLSVAWAAEEPPDPLLMTDFWMVRDVTISPTLTAFPLDAPPINGFIPRVAFGLTTQQAPNDLTFAAHPSSSPGGSTLPVGSTAAYFVGTLDSGGQSHVIHYDAAQIFNLGSANREGGYTAELVGAGGTEVVEISDALGIYMTGFNNASAPGGILSVTPGTLRGQWNTSILTTEQQSVLPNIIGSPMIAQYQAVIRNSQTRSLIVDGERLQTPQIDFQDLNTPPPTEYYELPLDVLSVNGVSPDPVFIASLDNFSNFADNPSSPTFWASMFAEVDISHTAGSAEDRQFLFDTGAEVTVLSRNTAAQVGFYTGGPNPSTPDFFVEVLGVGGVQQVPGFYMNDLSVVTNGGPLEWTNVPVLVLDLIDPRDGIGFVPGILGMNLFTDRDLVVNGGTTNPFVAIGPQLTPEWISNTGGNWGDDLKWMLGAPDEPDRPANFLDAITSPQTVVMNADFTAGSLRFDNANRYTINGPGTLTLETSTGQATIDVDTGSHTINAPLTLASDTTITVTPVGAKLTFSGDVNGADIAITKLGAGTVEMKHVRADALHVNAGAVNILPNGTSAGASRVSALTVATKLDLNNNDLVIDGGNYAAIQSLVVQGFNNGDWLGTGITSTSAATNPSSVSALGIVDNAEIGYSEFSGFTDLDGDEILVKYTYYGDADLGGTVNLDDFNQFLFGYNNGAGGPPAIWLNGDFDYNGSINLDDFNQFLFGLQNQGGALVGPELFATLSEFVAGEGVDVDLSTVPEAASAVLVALGAVLLRRRRART